MPEEKRSKGGWSQLNLDGSLAIRVLEGIPPSLRDWVIQKFRGFPSKQFRPSNMLPSVVLRSGQAIRYLNGVSEGNNKRKKKFVQLFSGPILGRHDKGGVKKYPIIEACLT